MPNDSESPLLPITDEAGQVRGLMDRSTAEYLASTDPDPTQASIDALLATVTRVRVVPFANFVRGAGKPRTLADVSDAESLEAFRQCFAIVEDPRTFGHCMCFGDPHLELYAGDRLAATIGYHHGFAIRWPVWKHDAVLAEPDRLLDWMSAHGVDGPRREVEAARHEAEESDRQVETWLEAMPECLRPFWDPEDFGQDPESIRVLVDALRAAIPSPELQALALFGWFGCGAGPWSGFPVYECVPESLLQAYPTELLVNALTRSTPTEAQWRGAARFFARWVPRRVANSEARNLPPELKRRLMEAARGTGIADNIQRAKHTYGG